jgi:uncharacterized membrane protein YuzA (DUF378 family)
MNKSNRRILIAVAVYIIVTVIAVSSGWWLVALALIVAGGFILYRINGSSIGITQFDFLKKIPGNKSWWTYGLVVFSTLYYVLLGFGVIKWGWVQFNVLIMLLIIALSAILAGSKDIPSTLQGVMKLWAALSISGILALMIAIRFTPGLIQSLDYSNSSAPPAQQSAGQQEQITQSLTPSPNPDWRRETLPSSNKAIVLERSGIIVLPEGKKRLFFSHMGDETGDLSPVITIAGKDYSAKGAGDFLLPEEVKGKVEVNFNGWDDKSYPGRLDAYQYYKTRKPFIELVE